MRRFRWLLHLLPPSFREEHGREMLLAWRDEGRDARGGRRLWTAALRDTLRVAPREHAVACARNVRLAARRLRRTPAFTATAVLTLALGTGAATAVFSVLNAVVQRPLPWRSPDRVALIWAVPPAGEGTWLSFPELEALQRDASAFASVAGMTDLRPHFTHEGGSEELQAVAVSHHFFALLGVRTVLGRDFVPEDDRSGGRAGRDRHRRLLAVAPRRRSCRAGPALRVHGAVWSGKSITVRNG